MTELRRRMIECLQLRGLSERTQDMYVRAVRQLAEHYRKSPDLISEEELRQYFLYLKNVKQHSRSASTIALCGIKFFFEQTLHRDWTTLRFVRAPREKKLPVILSLEEVRRLLDCVRLPRYRVCLTTIYSCGLRLQEGTHLQVPDIDSSRLLIHVRHGKGGKDRYVPLPHRTLARLRQYWVTHRHPVLIFPAPGRGGNSLSTATAPMPRSSVQGAFREALKPMFKGSGRSTVFLIGRWGRLSSDTLLQYDTSWCNAAWTGGALWRLQWRGFIPWPIYPWY
jgi:integrase/recombinase XerD